MRFIRINHAKKGPHKIDKKRYGPTTVQTTIKNRTKSTIYYGDFRKNTNFKKSCKIKIY